MKVESHKWDAGFYIHTTEMQHAYVVWVSYTYM